MTPPTSSIMFGDASSKSPLGLIKDYPLKIGDCKVPTDLTVLGMYGDKEVPLILGTPFLTIVGASIDFHKKLVTLHNINSKQGCIPNEGFFNKLLWNHNHCQFQLQEGQG
ncbi:unnamed protein product [Microthlaspi erraticum]|uniref:Aspartic peptidase DDI1-type domain-containing protein n=1 Tax=Microthlaspi erraticum TaxID=1685480 RepID=A0A6D2KZH5_9BRAS|nr:unnamed protein product [Microthlaspi erraticum]